MTKCIPFCPEYFFFYSFTETLFFDLRFHVSSLYALHCHVRRKIKIAAQWGPTMTVVDDDNNPLKFWFTRSIMLGTMTCVRCTFCATNDHSPGTTGRSLIKISHS